MPVNSSHVMTPAHLPEEGMMITILECHCYTGHTQFVEVSYSMGADTNVELKRKSKMLIYTTEPVQKITGLIRGSYFIYGAYVLYILAKFYWCRTGILRLL